MFFIEILAIEGYGLLYLAYTSAIILGLLHGSDPGHGWPLSALQSIDKKRSYWKAIFMTTILASGHFISTLFVVILVWFLGSFSGIYLGYLQIGAASLLLLFGLLGLYRGIRKHDNKGSFNSKLNELDALSIFRYSLLLGFAHEEEIALAAIILLGANPLLLAFGYALAVYASMLFWTIASVYLLTARRGIAEKIHGKMHILSPLALCLIGTYIMISFLF